VLPAAATSIQQSTVMADEVIFVRRIPIIASSELDVINVWAEVVTCDLYAFSKS